MKSRSFSKARALAGTEDRHRLEPDLRADRRPQAGPTPVYIVEPGIQVGGDRRSGEYIEHIQTVEGTAFGDHLPIGAQADPDCAFGTAIQHAPPHILDHAGWKEAQTVELAPRCRIRSIGAVRRPGRWPDCPGRWGNSRAECF